jgi:hypothetical protein
MRCAGNSGCLIAAIDARPIASTAAFAGIALVGAPPNTRAVMEMGAGLVLVWVIPTNPRTDWRLSDLSGGSILTDSL